MVRAFATGTEVPRFKIVCIYLSWKVKVVGKGSGAPPQLRHYKLALQHPLSTWPVAKEKPYLFFTHSRVKYGNLMKVRRQLNTTSIPADSSYEVSMYSVYMTVYTTRLTT